MIIFANLIDLSEHFFH